MPIQNVKINLRPFEAFREFAVKEEIRKEMERVTNRVQITARDVKAIEDLITSHFLYSTFKKQFKSSETRVRLGTRYMEPKVLWRGLNGRFYDTNVLYEKNFGTKSTEGEMKFSNIPASTDAEKFILEGLDDVIFGSLLGEIDPKLVFGDYMELQFLIQSSHSGYVLSIPSDIIKLEVSDVVSYHSIIPIVRYQVGYGSHAITGDIPITTGVYGRGDVWGLTMDMNVGSTVQIRNRINLIEVLNGRMSAMSGQLKNFTSTYEREFMALRILKEV